MIVKKAAGEFSAEKKDRSGRIESGGHGDAA